MRTDKPAGAQPHHLKIMNSDEPAMVWAIVSPFDVTHRIGYRICARPRPQSLNQIAPEVKSIDIGVCLVFI